MKRPFFVVISVVVVIFMEFVKWRVPEILNFQKSITSDSKTLYCVNVVRLGNPLILAELKNYCKIQTAYVNELSLIVSPRVKNEIRIEWQTLMYATLTHQKLKNAKWK